MNFKKTTMCLLALILAVSLIMIGCGQTTTTEPTASPSAGEAQPASSTASDGSGSGYELNAMLMGFLTQEPLFEENLARFKEQNPGVNVAVNIVESAETQFLLAYMADNAPDVVMLGDYSIRGDINGGRLHPLNDYLTQEQLDDMHPNFRDRISKDGNIYAWMANTDARIIYYNKAIFEKAGLDREYHPKTWSEWLEVMEKTNHVMGNDQYAYAFPGSSADIGTTLMWDSLVRQCGDVVVEDATGKIVLGNAATVRAAQFYYDLINTYKYTPETVFGMTGDIRLKDFAMEKLAMMMGGSWELGFLERDSEMDLNDVGWFPIPYADDGKPATISGFWNLAISSKTNHPDDAWSLISNLYSDEYLKQNIVHTKAVPTRASYMLLPELQNDPFTKGVSEYAAESAYPEISHQNFMEIMDPITETLISVWSGEQEIQSAFDALSNELNEQFAQ